MIIVVLIALVILGVTVAVRSKQKSNTEFFLHRAPVKARPLFVETWNTRDDIFRNAAENIRLYGSVVPDAYDLEELKYIAPRRTTFGYKGRKHVSQSR